MLGSNHHPHGAIPGEWQSLGNGNPWGMTLVPAAAPDEPVGARTSTGTGSLAITAMLLWHLGTRFSGAVGSAEGMVGFHGLGELFQPKLFSGFMIPVTSFTLSVFPG